MRPTNHIPPGLRFLEVHVCTTLSGFEGEEQDSIAYVVASMQKWTQNEPIQKNVVCTAPCQKKHLNITANLEKLKTTEDALEKKGDTLIPSWCVWLPETGSWWLRIINTACSMSPEFWKRDTPSSITYFFPLFSAKIKGSEFPNLHGMWCFVSVGFW